MSQNANHGAVDPTAALQEIESRVYAPAYLSTLAELGVVPQTQKQAETLCRIGRRLLFEHQTQQVKAAEATGDFFSTAADQLDRLLGAPEQAPDYGLYNDAAIKQAAATYLADPALVAAAGTIQTAVQALSHRS